MRNWNSIAYAPEGVAIETKIDDEHGPRNIQVLTKRNNLWWVSDGSMYVYYTPTHWRYCEEKI